MALDFEPQRWTALRTFMAVVVLLLGLGGLQTAAQQQEDQRPLVLVAAIKGAIGPAMGKHVADAIAAAAERDASVLVLQLNTPGGLATTMRDVISEILASPVPVIGYVAPSGAHAASAGTYILYASHLAAMAPGTNIGAATPVQMGGGGPPLPGGGRSDDGQDGSQDKKPAPDNPVAPTDAMGAKAVSDAVAFIRSLAEMRDRDAEWAEQAVREAASLTASAALKRGVIELVADDLRDLLVKADGHTVSVNRTKATLATANARVERFEVSWQTELLAILTNPNIAFILLIVGVYGLVFEFYSPGSIGPGVVGVICLVLGFYALNLLPLNYAGLALILVGLVCMAAEAMLPSFGILGIGGLVAFVLGSILLFETDLPEYRLAWPVIAGTAAVSGAILVFLLGYAWRAHRRPVVTGTGRFVGQRVEVLDWSGSHGHVRLAGERWQAKGPSGLSVGQHAVVREIHGLTLIVGEAGNERETES